MNDTYKFMWKFYSTLINIYFQVIEYKIETFFMIILTLRLLNKKICSLEKKKKRWLYKYDNFKYFLYKK